MCAKLLVCNPGHTIDIVAEAWSTSRRLAQGYIARAVLELNDVPIKESLFSTPSESAPQGSGNWAEEVEYTLDPRKQPEVVDVSAKIAESNYISALAREYGISEHRVSIAHMVNQRSPTPGDHGLRLLLDKMRKRDQILDQERLFRASQNPTQGNVPSKRSKLSAEQRTRRNRKMQERRTNKRRSAPQQ